MDARRSRVLEEAATWLRTAWHHSAAIKGGGVDCGLFVKACYVATGYVEDFDPGPYPPDWMLHRSEEVFLGWLKAHADRVEKPEPADIAIFKFGRCFSHAALVIVWPQIIHAYRPERAVVYGDAARGPLRDRQVQFYSRFARLDA